MSKGIYCYIDKKDNTIVYIGKDSNIHNNARHLNHISYSQYEKQKINKILQNNLSRYEYQKLWEIDDCSDNHLNQMEIYFISEYNPRFNFTNGGDGISGFKHTKDAKRKMSQERQGEKHPLFGKHHSVQTKQKISKNNARYWKGKNLSDEHKEKISKALQGRFFSQETRKKISTVAKKRCGKNNPFFNKKHSKETKRKLSKIHNTTGFYRVYITSCPSCKKGFRWSYQYTINSQHKAITSTDLNKLKEKVLEKNLEWYVINEENALKSLKKK